MGVFSGNDVDASGDAEVTLKTAAGAELLGQQVSAASLPVVIASNQSSVPTVVGPSTLTTYSVGIPAFTPGATPTDIITIIGSATRTVRVLSIELTPVQTTRSLVSFFIVKRSAADTAGTSTTPTVVPSDSNNAAATAVVRVYTANPSLGAAIGNVSVIRVLSDDSGANAVGGSGYTWDFTKGGLAQGIVLRGVAQTLALNMAGVTLPINLSVIATITWTEE